MYNTYFAWIPVLLALAPVFADELAVEVSDDASLRTALRSAGPGTRIRIAAGHYRPGVYAANLKGTERRPIVIEGADENNPPTFEGGNEAWHFSDCAYLTLRNIAVKGQRSNGINVDDGGSYDTPTHNVVLEKIRVADIGPQGNHDGIKLSGVDDFVVRHCSIEGWGGQAVDMVGCHRGVIERCTFAGKPGFSQSAGPQTKGGSRDIAIRGCRFSGPVARAVNVGGSTGLPYFRPKGTLYEAKDIVVEGCAFAGGEAPIAYVGVHGATVRYNTFYRPEKWVLRILQETTEQGFAPCRRGRFEHNLIVFRRSDVGVFVNIGPNTAPETFTFAENLWFCEDRPTASKPDLPVPEVRGVYGVDPRLTDPAKNDFRPRSPVAVKFGVGAWTSK